MTDTLILALMWGLPAFGSISALSSHVLSASAGDTLAPRAWLLAALGGLCSCTVIALVWRESGYSDAVLGPLLWDVSKTLGHQCCFTYRYLVNGAPRPTALGVDDA